MLVAATGAFVGASVSATVLKYWDRPPATLATWMGGLALVSALGAGMSYHVANEPDGTEDFRHGAMPVATHGIATAGFDCGC